MHVSSFLSALCTMRSSLRRIRPSDQHEESLVYMAMAVGGGGGRKFCTSFHTYSVTDGETHELNAHLNFYNPIRQNIARLKKVTKIRHLFLI
jgi:hypothetical protein